MNFRIFRGILDKIRMWLLKCVGNYRVLIEGIFSKVHQGMRKMKNLEAKMNYLMEFKGSEKMQLFEIGQKRAPTISGTTMFLLSSSSVHFLWL